jgi:hypothetical protein
LVRAPPCHGGGCGFEPRRLRALHAKMRYVQADRAARLQCEMNNSATNDNKRRAGDPTMMAMQEMERYCAAHPNSPAATCRPRLAIRGRTFVALLGPSIEQGIAGFGDTVQAALRAFDVQYLSSLTPRANEK